MNVLIFSILSCSMIMLSGCNSAKSSKLIELIGDLHPYGSFRGEDPFDRMDRVENELKELLSDPIVRSELLKHIGERVDRRRLSHKEQIALANAIGVIAHFHQLSNEESMAIIAIVQKGRKHNDFYGFALGLAQVPLSPEYLSLYFELLSYDQDIHARHINPDGGKMIKYCVQKFALGEIKRVTGQDFGRDYDAWVSWWDKHSPEYDFDWKEYKYVRKAESKENRGEGQTYTID